MPKPTRTPERIELGQGWHLLKVQRGGFDEYIICDSEGDRLGMTPKHVGELMDALSRQAPVPTSGAVEGVYGILADIRECIDFDGHDLDEKQAAAIIQQYGAAREVEGRRDQEQFHLEEMGTQPPAADGKLREALEDEWVDAEDCDPTHAALCSRAVRWLINMGCRCAVKEITTVSTTEICDAAGFKDDTCIVVEVKTSRSDFLRDAKKFHRREGKGMGSYRYFMTPAGMIKPEEVPEGWGLVEVTGKICRVVKGFKQLRPYHDELPFPNSNKRAEIGLLTSLVRRLRDGDVSAQRIATRQHAGRLAQPASGGGDE